MILNFILNVLNLLLSQRKMSTIMALGEMKALSHSLLEDLDLQGFKPILALVLYDEINPLHLTILLDELFAAQAVLTLL